VPRSIASSWHPASWQHKLSRNPKWPIFFTHQLSIDNQSSIYICLCLQRSIEQCLGRRPFNDICFTEMCLSGGLYPGLLGELQHSQTPYRHSGGEGGGEEEGGRVQYSVLYCTVLCIVLSVLLCTSVVMWTGFVAETAQWKAPMMKFVCDSLIVW